jgi:hypothetical protein
MLALGMAAGLGTHGALVILDVMKAQRVIRMFPGVLLRHNVVVNVDVLRVVRALS